MEEKIKKKCPVLGAVTFDIIYYYLKTKKTFTGGGRSEGKKKILIKTFTSVCGSCCFLLLTASDHRAYFILFIYKNIYARSTAVSVLRGFRRANRGVPIREYLYPDHKLVFNHFLLRFSRFSVRVLRGFDRGGEK